MSALRGQPTGRLVAGGGFAVLLVVSVAVGIWIGNWVNHELRILELGILRRVLRQLIRVAVGVAFFGPGFYAIWVFGWYARQPKAGQIENSETSAPEDQSAR